MIFNKSINYSSLQCRPHWQSIISHPTYACGIIVTAEMILWLMLFLQVVRSSGVLAYKDKLIAAIKSTIHLKCKEAATLGATVGGICSVL